MINKKQERVLQEDFLEMVFLSFDHHWEVLENSILLAFLGDCGNDYNAVKQVGTLSFLCLAEISPNIIIIDRFLLWVISSACRFLLFCIPS